MRNLFIFVLAVFTTSCTENQKSVVVDNLFSSNIPDLNFFNANNVVKNDTVTLIANKDTIALYIYDSLGRFSQYNYKRMWSRKETLKYLGNTNFPIFKHIRVDYSLSYSSSLVKINNDTILSYWYYEFGAIEDTFQYVFKSNKISELISSSLNDYEKLKLKRSFYYDNDRLVKIVSIPVWGEKSGFGKIDSVIASYSYSNKMVNEITESYYCKNKKFNYRNKYFFNVAGFPIKHILRDTLEIVIR